MRATALLRVSAEAWLSINPAMPHTMNEKLQSRWLSKASPHHFGKSNEGL
jgi:hypothetical protein